MIDLSRFRAPALVLALSFNCLQAGTLSPLTARGYTVLPVPQKVALDPRDFPFADGWQLVLDSGVKPADVAIDTLKEQLSERFHLSLAESGAARGRGGVIRLALSPNSVDPGNFTDKDKATIAEQAYRLTLKPQEIRIVANASPGLFYGVQTLLQLPQRRDGRLLLPEGEITDWPDLGMRIIYWDDAHHLEPLPVLKQAVRQAAFYKINGFSIKLEGHFQFQHAPALVEPYAMSPAELQELTDYALKYHIQLIPYLDAPSHIAFILKHPEYAKLREYPDSNYEACVTNPETYKLYEGMFQDLLDANKGGKFFVLSTDESYYVGLAKNDQCNEVDAAKEKGSVGKLLADFVSRTSKYLHDRGRTVMFWGEYPMKPDDISALPSYMVNGEVYGPEFDPVFKAHGIRQMIFTSTVGWKEFFFSNYYVLPAADHIPAKSIGAYEAVTHGPGYVGQMLDTIENTPARKNADLMGVFVAGWADTGIHPEVMWLGYATGTAMAWHPGGANEQELMGLFYPLFYGAEAGNMGRIYQLMSGQGQFWKESWETAPSNARTPVWGDWDRINNPPQPAEDQTLPPLPVPSSNVLAVSYDWSALSERRLQMASRFLADNDELMDRLHRAVQQADFNRYNLELYIAIAHMYRQNLDMLLDMGRINAALLAAQTAAAKPDVKRAVSSLDRALDLADYIRQERNQAYSDTVATWYKSWYPRVMEANGRTFVNKVDDVKDHLPVRTADMTYLIYRQLLYPLGDWAAKVQDIRNGYAKAHGLPLRSRQWDWKDTKALAALPRVGDDQ
ncbi:MAG: beta-N-acetylhexosaminidase [Bryobacteraceae bacterium]